MSIRKWMIIILTCFAVKAYTQDKVVYLKNENIRAGFLPDVGGRMVFLAPIGEPNFLLSDSTLWNEPEKDRITPTANSPFKPYNGLITWLGPQSAWWTRQDILPEKKKRADVWPPDPYLIYSKFEILEHTNTLLVMRGPGSPVSGVQLTKRFELKGNSIAISVTAKNIRKKSVAWDIWSNARFPATTNFKVPVSGNNMVRIKAEETTLVDTMKYNIQDGFFSYLPEMPSENKLQRISKAFIYPSAGTISVKKSDWELQLNFERVAKDEIHPEQALVEVYNCISANGQADLLELEHHSAYASIKPGKSIHLKEQWTFLKTSGNH